MKKILSALLLTLVAVTMMAQQMPPMPVDPAIKTGKLDNGLTYYVRYNAEPEHRVNFYIAQKVGSIEEEEDQRGLAHFLEHMAFNGSENFKGNSLIEFCRANGVEFGSDLNAYTSIDETVYRVCKVPSTKPEVLDSCLLILRDWSCGLLLENEEIDKERGVIHEEWRLRSSASQRIFNRQLPALFPGSKYGLRMPIGLMEVIDNFSYEALRQYYKKWYRPDNQAIIVVGDIDPDKTVEKIKALFGPIQMPENPAPVPVIEVPDNNEPIIIIDKDKELQMENIMICMKHDVIPSEMKGSIAYLMIDYAKDMMAMMLNQRLSEMAQDANCPFLYAACEDETYLGFSRTKDAFTMVIVPKEGMQKEALAAVLLEAKRAADHGFVSTEYFRAKEEYISQLEKINTNREKRDNDVYGNQCRDHFLKNEPLAAIDQIFPTMQMVTQQLPVDMINEMMQELVCLNDTNIVILDMAPEKEGYTLATAEEYKLVLDAAKTAQVEAYVDNVKDEPLITTLPKAGKVKKVEENKALGYKKLTLSNGAVVNLKKTDFKDDEVVLAGISKGGKALYGAADYNSLKVFDDFISVSGLGNFDNQELQKALAGKQANVSLGINNTHETLNGRSTPKDLETLFQLTYLTMTNIKKDEKAAGQTMSLLQQQLANLHVIPEMALQDSLIATIYDHNPRFGQPHLEDLPTISYDRILQIAKERTANAADWQFTFVGNFEEEQIIPLIEQYIASLPANKKQKEECIDIFTFTKGNVTNKFTRKMETPKANAYMIWRNNSTPYTLDADIKAEAAGQVLAMIYLKKIREDASAAYSASAQGSALPGVKPTIQLLGVCPMKPEMADLAIKIMEEEALNLGNNIDADMLAKTKETMQKQYEDAVRKNGFWINIIQTNEEYGIDCNTGYLDLLKSVTPENLSQFVKTHMLGHDSTKVIMLPEE